MSTIHDFKDLIDQVIPFPLQHFLEIEDKKHPPPDHKGTVEWVLISAMKLSAEYFDELAQSFVQFLYVWEASAHLLYQEVRLHVVNPALFQICEIVVRNMVFLRHLQDVGE